MDKIGFAVVEEKVMLEEAYHSVCVDQINPATLQIVLLYLLEVGSQTWKALRFLLVE